MAREFLVAQRVGVTPKLNRKRFLANYGENTLAQQVIAEVATVLDSVEQALGHSTKLKAS